MTRRSIALGSGAYLPERIVSNDELAARVDTTDAWIPARTGIKQRHVAAPKELTSDLAIRAAEAALADAGVAAADVDLIVLATGYYTQQELVRRLLGNDVAEKVGEIWGIGEDGEMANMWKRTAQDGLWFIAGSLAQCRIFSRYLALQIKACEAGLISTDLSD